MLTIIIGSIDSSCSSVLKSKLYRFTKYSITSLLSKKKRDLNNEAYGKHIHFSSRMNKKDSGKPIWARFNLETITFFLRLIQCPLIAFDSLTAFTTRQRDQTLLTEINCDGCRPPLEYRYVGGQHNWHFESFKRTASSFSANETLKCQLQNNQELSNATVR